MAQDLTVILENRPGTLADMGEAFGKAGINVNGICGFQSGEQGELHVLVEDGTAARSALEGAGLTVSGARDVLVLEIEDKPGTLGEMTRKIANAGVNVDLVYLATNTRLVVGADDLGKAQAAL